MSGHIRISDEKSARWHRMQHRIRMDRLREDEARDRIKRQRTRPERCPHCGQPLERAPTDR